MDTISLTLIVIFAFLTGFLLAYIWLKAKQQAWLKQVRQTWQSEKEQLQASVDNFQNQVAELSREYEKKSGELKLQHEQDLRYLEKKWLDRLSEKDQQIVALNAELKNWEDKWRRAQEDFAQKEKAMRQDIEIWTQQILEEKSKKFTALNQANMSQILDPFKEAIKAFKEKVEQNEKESIGRHSALKEQLTELQKLNQRLSQDAINLTKALKGESKTQGIWGETILNRLLEKSGLEKDREYFVQQSFKAVEGTNRQRVQPDVVIQLPDQKKLIVDAKVSLTAYERYINTDDESLQQEFVKQHVASLKAHINGLAKKSYDALLEGETPEFILMFVAVEPAFSLALKSDPELYNYAFDKNIVMVTPSTLLATLKIVDNMWRNEKQRKNALEIATKAGALYDKFYGFVSDLKLVENKLSQAQESLGKAVNKLHTGRGNLIGSIEKLKKLGAKAKKQLPISNEDD